MSFGGCCCTLTLAAEDFVGVAGGGSHVGLVGILRVSEAEGCGEGSDRDLRGREMVIGGLGKWWLRWSLLLLWS